VATIDGVDVHLLTVESWADRVAVRLVGAPTEQARPLIAAHHVAMDEWAVRRRAGRDEPPPAEPAQKIHESLRLHLDDGTGTAFRLISAQCGGTGTEWLCEWFFAPAVASAAKRLTLKVTTIDGGASTHTFDFA
jgi:hypothetical protein